MTEFESLKERALVLGSLGKEAEFAEAMKLADWFKSKDHKKLEATALDVAFGLKPDDESVCARRRIILDSLAVCEHGIDYRYVPAGTFLMGSEEGDTDEKPVHPVRTDEYWVASVPVSWALYARLLGWSPPPRSAPSIRFTEENRMQEFHLHEMNKVRMIYCETETIQGGGWSQHIPPVDHSKEGQRSASSKDQSRRYAPRENDEAPYTYDVKPMVAVAVREIEDLCFQVSDNATIHRLPSEAQWEKAARGGLIGCRFSWGDSVPDETLADFGHYGQWRIFDPREFPPNGYGLHGMCGTVWEWTRDRYDSLAYSQATIPSDLEEKKRNYALRGGSWVDCADAITVSFRMSRSSGHWKDADWGGHGSPNIGFRLVREETGEVSSPPTSESVVVPTTVRQEVHEPASEATVPESDASLVIDSHKRNVWAILGYLLLLPIVFAPVIYFSDMIPADGDKASSLGLLIVGSFFGACILIYHYWFSIRKITIGSGIIVHHATREQAVSWEDVESVFIERRYSYTKGVLVEVTQLNICLNRSPICIDIDPERSIEIIETALNHAPSTCSVSTEIRSVRH